MHLGNEYHIPVLYNETIDMLVHKKNGKYIDCTLGGGTHSKGILDELDENGILISIDQDEDAINFCKEKLKNYEKNWKVFKENFENIDIVAYMSGYEKFDGILMDIGVSSRQLDNPERGFSYRFDSKLDMRMNKDSNISAYNVVNEYDEEKLANIIYKYGEERYSKRIARAICEYRTNKKIETTFELNEIIKKSYPTKSEKHPSKRTFQAIRIEVNRELEILEKAIEKSVKLLNSGGRLCIITFHSLEDRIVKNKFKELAKACKCAPEIPICVCGGKQEYKILTKKPIVPSKEELDFNNRSHSSKLRVLEKI